MNNTVRNKILTHTRFKKLLGYALVFFCVSRLEVHAQGSRGWQPFEGIKFEYRYNETIDDYLMFPEFSDDILAKDGTVIQLTGYYVPFDIEGGGVILSRYPYAQCFFCGNAGPESVAEVYFQKQQNLRFRPDQLITVSGVLKLNADDADHLSLILEQAALVNN